MKTSDRLLVFDMKRFAVHDGDGIRTTVFLKGCGLRCQWCQNPEGLEKRRSVLFLSNKCMHCGRCRAAAEPSQLTWEKDHPEVNRKYRGNCDNIVDVCPTGALHYDSTWYTAEELMQKIRRDEAFFRHGGGVTFSGGEPFLAGEPLLEVLQLCREAGIHTACETALYVPEEMIHRAADFMDQMYCDMKIFDPVQHEELTGREPSLIRRNLAWLLDGKHASKVTVRTPLIPGMTDSPENIYDIAAWISSHYPDVRYELLNYNELAPAKYPMTGKTYLPGVRHRLTEEQMEKLRKTATDAGVKNLIV